MRFGEGRGSLRGKPQRDGGLEHWLEDGTRGYRQPMPQEKTIEPTDRGSS
jgi:hypothetical protein